MPLTTIGLFYFAPIVGTIIGSVSGNWLHGKQVIAKPCMRDADIPQILSANGTLVVTEVS